MKKLILALTIFLLTILPGCGGDNDDEVLSPVNQSEKPTVTVNAILPDELKVVQLDLGGAPLRVEVDDSRFWTMFLDDGRMIFGVTFEGRMTASRNYKIKQFNILVEPLNPSASLAQDPDPINSGIYYPEVLAKGQAGDFAMWTQYYANDKLFEGFVYRIVIEAEEVDEFEIKKLGVIIRSL